MRCWLLWMIAVCGIGSPKGRLNSATTAYQSASPPMVAASANAATTPKAGWTCSSDFAVTNSTSVAASTSVRQRFSRAATRRRVRRRRGASKEKVAGDRHEGFRRGLESLHRCSRPRRHPEVRAFGSAIALPNAEPRRIDACARRPLLSFEARRRPASTSRVSASALIRGWTAAIPPKKKARLSGAFEDWLVSATRSGGSCCRPWKNCPGHSWRRRRRACRVYFRRGLGARDEHFAAGTDHVRLDLGGFAQRLGGSELVDCRRRRLRRPERALPGWLRLILAASETEPATAVSIAAVTFSEPAWRFGQREPWRVLGLLLHVTHGQLPELPCSGAW